MDLEFCEDGSLEVGMLDYVKDAINDFPEDVGRKSYKTPTSGHLFQVRKDNNTRVLPEEQAVKFHHTGVQLLFLSGCEELSKPQWRSSPLEYENYTRMTWGSFAGVFGT